MLAFFFPSLSKRNQLKMLEAPSAEKLCFSMKTHMEIRLSILLQTVSHIFGILEIEFQFPVNGRLNHLCWATLHKYASSIRIGATIQLRKNSVENGSVGHFSFSKAI